MKLSLPVIRLARFATVGIANTLVSLAVIALALAAGLGDLSANAIGYVIGLCLSFVGNRRWTFQVEGRATSAELLRYLACFAFAYSGNLAALGAFLALGFNNMPIAHVPGMIVYTLLFFWAANRFAFAGANKVDYGLKKWWPEFALLALAGLTFVSLVDIPLTHDVAWQFWIARQMLGGAKLYTDIWEVNPPLWFWSAIPVEYASQTLGFSARSILVALVVGMGAISACCFGRLSGVEQPARRCAIMIGAFWFCVPMPFFDFGQREQLAVICTLPYVALISRRARGQHVEPASALLIGLFSAYGFALKHYFLLAPILLESWLILRDRRDWKPARPETLALAGCALAYALATIAFAPNFLNFMVPMVEAAYGGYNMPFVYMVDESAQLIWLLGGIALWSSGAIFRRDADPLISALAITTLAFLAAYFLQQKGWQYHAIPATATLLLAIVVRFSEERPIDLLRHPLAVVAVALAVTLSFGYGRYYNFLRSASEPQFSQVEPGDFVAALSADPMWVWPILEEHRIAWPMRLYSYWMLPAIAQDEVMKRHDPAIRKVIEQIHRQTFEDLSCHPPAVVLIETRPRYAAQPASFDVVAFFMRDPKLRNFMIAHYVEAPRTPYFRTFRRKGQFQMRGTHCRRIAPLTYDLPPAIA